MLFREARKVAPIKLWPVNNGIFIVECNILLQKKKVTVIPHSHSQIIICFGYFINYVINFVLEREYMSCYPSLIVFER